MCAYVLALEFQGAKVLDEGTECLSGRGELSIGDEEVAVLDTSRATCGGFAAEAEFGFFFRGQEGDEDVDPVSA
jgi:hypothetical protein